MLQPLLLAATLIIDAADLSGFVVELRIRNAPAGLTLAANAIDFNRYLATHGLKLTTVWTAALEGNGRPARDLRLWGWQPEGDSGLLLNINDPSSIWGKAGLHTGDRVVSMNGAPVLGGSAGGLAQSAPRLSMGMGRVSRHIEILANWGYATLGISRSYLLSHNRDLRCFRGVAQPRAGRSPSAI